MPAGRTLDGVKGVYYKERHKLPSVESAERRVIGMELITSCQRLIVIADRFQEIDDDDGDEVPELVQRIEDRPRPICIPGRRSSRWPIEQSLANIQKYSKPGEDLDWTKVQNPNERKRMQVIINQRKMKDRNAASKRSYAKGTSLSNITTSKLRVRKPRAAKQQYLVDRDATSVLQPFQGFAKNASASTGLPSRAWPLEWTLANIANYSKPGEDLDWTKVTDRVQRRSMQLLIGRRKQKHTVAEFRRLFWSVGAMREGQNSAINQKADELRGRTKPVTKTVVTRPVRHSGDLRRQQSLAAIAKYSKPGEDLDWTKVFNITRRKQMQQKIGQRKFKYTAAQFKRLFWPPEADIEARKDSVSPRDTSGTDRMSDLLAPSVFDRISVEATTRKVEIIDLAPESESESENGNEDDDDRWSEWSGCSGTAAPLLFTPRQPGPARAMPVGSPNMMPMQQYNSLHDIPDYQLRGKVLPILQAFPHFSISQIVRALEMRRGNIRDAMAYLCELRPMPDVFPI